MSYIGMGLDDQSCLQQGQVYNPFTGECMGPTPEERCMSAGNVYNPVTGDCVASSVVTPAQTCKNAGMTWNGSACIDPLADKTKPGTSPLEPGGPGTPGWGGGGAQPIVSEGTAKAAMPWLIGAAVGVGVLALIATAASKKKPAGDKAHAVANRLLRSF